MRRKLPGVKLRLSSKPEAELQLPWPTRSLCSRVHVRRSSPWTARFEAGSAQQSDALAADPRPPGAKALVGIVGVLRIRVGAYRVLYEVQDDHLVVLVIDVGHRREIYR